MDRYDWAALFMAGLFVLSILLIAHLCFSKPSPAIEEPKPSAMHAPGPVEACQEFFVTNSMEESVESLMSLMEACAE